MYGLEPPVVAVPLVVFVLALVVEYNRIVCANSKTPEQEAIFLETTVLNAQLKELHLVSDFVLVSKLKRRIIALEKRYKSAEDERKESPDVLRRHQLFAYIGRACVYLPMLMSWWRRPVGFVPHSWIWPLTPMLSLPLNWISSSWETHFAASSVDMPNMLPVGIIGYLVLSHNLGAALASALMKALVASRVRVTAAVAEGKAAAATATPRACPQ